MYSAVVDAGAAHFNVCAAVPSSLSKTEEITSAFSQTKFAAQTRSS